MDQPLAATPDGVDDGAWSEACADVRAYCGWHVAPSIEEELVLDGSSSTIAYGSVRLLLPSLHVTAVESVTVDDVEISLDVVTFERKGVLSVPLTSWEWSDWSTWSGSPAKVVATVTHGHDECPKELLGVLRDLVKVGGLQLARRSVVGPFAHDWSNAAQAGPGGVLDAYAGRLGRYRIEPRP